MCTFLSGGGAAPTAPRLTDSMKVLPMASKRTPAERFWPKVDKTDSCWLWTAALNTKGYGQFHNGERMTGAHRWAYESVHGPIPPGLVIDHLCRVRHCVRPDHMEAVTNRENVLRGDTIPAHNASKTHCDSGHEFTEANTVRPFWDPNRRLCLTCKRGVA